jgi:RimJ/RimL family protein N-acetyltransferase
MMTTTATAHAARTVIAPPTTTTDWRKKLPILRGERVILRELRSSDAASLLEMLSTEEVARFISPPPTTVQGFERFIEWTHRERAAGRYVCFGVVPEGMEQAIGIFQVRQLGGAMEIAEWGFALGSAFWGTGLFTASAKAVLTFTFEEMKTHRLEARSVVENGRGNGALQKIGATREGILRKSFLRDDTYFDQVLWSIVAEDWRTWAAAPAPPRVN